MVDSDAVELASRWQEFRQLRRWMLALWAGWVPGMAGVFSLVEWRAWPAAVGMIAAAVYMIAFATVGARLTDWPCPRCHNRFVWRPWGGKLYPRQCEHCGLREGAAPTEVADRSSVPA